MTTLGWLGWRSIWAPPKGGEAATVPCIYKDRASPLDSLIDFFCFTFPTQYVAYMDCLPYVRLMGFSWADGDHDLMMMMVVPDSAGDANRVRMHAYMAYTECRI
jgi:hypothetical protein